MQIILGILLVIMWFLIAVISLAIIIFLIAIFLSINYKLFLKCDLQGDGSQSENDRGFYYDLEIKILGFIIFPREKGKRNKSLSKRRKKKALKKKQLNELKMKNEASFEDEINRINAIEASEKKSYREKVEHREDNKEKEKFSEKELENLEIQLQEDSEEGNEDRIKFLDQVIKQWERVEHYNFESLIKPTKRFILKILKRLKPKEFNIQAEIGLDSYRTGILMAFIYSLNIFSENIEIDGNYEEQKLEGSLDMCGKLKLVYFIAPSIRFIISKPILKLLLLLRKNRKITKKEKENERT